MPSAQLSNPPILCLGVIWTAQSAQHRTKEGAWYLLYFLRLYTLSLQRGCLNHKLRQKGHAPTGFACSKWIRKTGLGHATDKKCFPSRKAASHGYWQAFAPECCIVNGYSGYAPVAKSPETGVCACTHRCVQAAGVTVSRAPKQDCCSLPGTASALESAEISRVPTCPNCLQHRFNVRHHCGKTKYVMWYPIKKYKQSMLEDVWTIPLPSSGSPARCDSQSRNSRVAVFSWIIRVYDTLPHWELTCLCQSDLLSPSPTCWPKLQGAHPARFTRRFASRMWKWHKFDGCLNHWIPVLEQRRFVTSWSILSH